MPRRWGKIGRDLPIQNVQDSHSGGAEGPQVKKRPTKSHTFQNCFEEPNHLNDILLGSQYCYT